MVGNLIRMIRAVFQRRIRRGRTSVPANPPPASGHAQLFTADQARRMAITVLTCCLEEGLLDHRTYMQKLESLSQEKG